MPRSLPPDPSPRPDFLDPWVYGFYLVLVRTIVKPLWRLPPSDAKNRLVEHQHSQTKNVALKSPKISLIKRYFGRFKGYFLRFLLIRCFLGVVGVLGHKGFTIVPKCSAGV